MAPIKFIVKPAMASMKCKIQCCLDIFRPAFSTYLPYSFKPGNVKLKFWADGAIMALFTYSIQACTEFNFL